MRIIAGEAGSLKLSVPPSITRPTTDRVREAVFSSLGERVIEASVLDLFAGSGSLGIESLSRGAASAVFIDNSTAAGKAIEGNLKTSKLRGGRFVRQDVMSFLASARKSQYDLVFADPPYARDEETAALLQSILEQENLPQSLSEGGLLILESFAKSPLPEMPLWSVEKEKIYGKTRVSYLTPNA